MEGILYGKMTYLCVINKIVLKYLNVPKHTYISIKIQDVLFLIVFFADDHFLTFFGVEDIEKVWTSDLITLV